MYVCMYIYRIYIGYIYIYIYTYICIGFVLIPSYYSTLS